MPNDVTILWDFPEADFPLWLASVCGSGTYQDYRRKLEDDAKTAQAQGRRLLVVNTTARHVFDAMTRMGLPATLEGCQQALQRLYWKD